MLSNHDGPVKGGSVVSSHFSRFVVAQLLLGVNQIWYSVAKHLDIWYPVAKFQIAVAKHVGFVASSQLQKITPYQGPTMICQHNMC